MASLGLLHSILQHSRLYGASVYNSMPEWSQNDATTASHTICDFAKLAIHVKHLGKVISDLYTDKCLDSQDQAAIDNLVRMLVVNKLTQVVNISYVQSRSGPIVLWLMC